MSYNKYIDEFYIEGNWDMIGTDDTVYATYKNSFHGHYSTKDIDTAIIMSQYRAYLNYLNNQQNKLMNVINAIQDLVANYIYKTTQEKETESNVLAFREKAIEDYDAVIEAKKYFNYLYKLKYQSLKSKRKNYLNNNYYKFRFDETNGIVEATSTYAGKLVTGIARCSEEDNYNPLIGMEIAKRKCNIKILNKRIKNLEKQEDKLQDQIIELEEKINKILEYRMNAKRERALNEYELEALGNGTMFKNCKAKVVLDNE